MSENATGLPAPVSDRPQAAQRTRYRVAGMDCASCATKIETALGRLPGISDVGVSVPAGTVTVSHAESLAPEHIANQVVALGYEVIGREKVVSPSRVRPITNEHVSEYDEAQNGAAAEPAHQFA